MLCRKEKMKAGDMPEQRRWQENAFSLVRVPGLPNARVSGGGYQDLRTGRRPLYPLLERYSKPCREPKCPRANGPYDARPERRLRCSSDNQNGDATR